MLNFSRRTFAGHESFTFRSGWLKKGYDLVATDPLGLTDQDTAMVKMGVGKNMVRSIRHWCLATEVLAPDGKGLAPTPFGRSLFDNTTGWDPYLEDPASLWLLHSHLGMNYEKATIFAAVLSGLPGHEFTRDRILQFLQEALRRAGVDTVAADTLRRDTEIFLRTYTTARESKGRTAEESLECPLTELGFMHLMADNRTYVVHRGERNTLPDAMLAYLIVRFWSGIKNTPSSLSWRALLYDPLSPGRILRMEESEMAARMERLGATYPTIFLTAENAGIKQLQLGHAWPADPLSILAEYYQGAPAEVLA